MIIFKNIRYKNFLSTGNAFNELQLNNPQPTLIMGSNGAGKSTVLDAMSFALFGKSFRKLNKPLLINAINGRDCLVEIEFSIGRKEYLIRRGQKPAIFEIYCDSVLIDQDARGKDYQTFLEQSILKLNHKSFCQVVVLGSSTFVPFMRLTAADRRYIIEDLLDIQIFSLMNSVLKVKLADIREDSMDVDREIEMNEERKKLAESYLSNIREDNKKKIADCRARIKAQKAKRVQANKEIKTLNDEIEVLQNQVADSQSVEAKLRNYQSTDNKLEQSFSKLEKDIAFYTDNAQCPTCKQDIDEEFRKDTISVKRDRLSKLEDALARIDAEIESTSIRLKEISKINSTIRLRNTTLGKLNASIHAIDSFIETMLEDITELQSRKGHGEEHEERISELTIKLKFLHEKRDRLIEDRYYLDVVAMMLKDSGIKTKIIGQYLPIINRLVNKFLSAMDFFVNFNLDENFSEVIKSRGRDDFSYENFSEGERLRIDIALLLTWREIARLRNSVNTNLLILDEIFDSSLDTIGVEYMLKILADVSKGSSVIVISPKGDTMMDKFPSIYRAYKEKNFSYLEAA